MWMPCDAMWTHPPPLSSEAIPSLQPPPLPTTNLPSAPALHHPPPTSSLRQPSTTHQELHPVPPIHPCNLAPEFTPPGSGRPPRLTRTHHFPAGRQRRGRLTYNQKTALTSWFSLTSTQTQVLSVKRGMTASVSQICFRNQMSLCPASCSNFLCTTATCLITQLSPRKPSQRCHSTSLPSNSTSSP